MHLKTYYTREELQNMSSSEKILEALDYVLVRMPVYGINSYFKYENENPLNNFKNDAVFREAVYIASPSLYYAAVNYERAENKESIQRALRSYYKRICFRATPFGTFSCFGVGNLSDATKYLESHEFLYKKYYQASKIWLVDLINKIEKNIENIQDVFVQTNYDTVIKDNRIFLYYSFKNKEDNGEPLTSVYLTQQINYILDRCKQPQKISCLIQELILHYGIGKKCEINLLILKLIEYNYLLTELRNINITIKDISTKINNKMMSGLLDTISEEMQALNEQQGTDIHKIEKLKNLMGKVVNSTDYLKVDSIISNMEIYISQSITQQLCEYYENLSLLTNKDAIREDKKAAFYNGFVERYGESVRIPLSEIFLNGMELYKGTQLNQSVNDSELHKYIVSNFSVNTEKIDLTVFFLNMKKEKKDKDFKASEVEVYGSVVEKNGEQYFCINNQTGSDALGASYGRFTEIKDCFNVNSLLSSHYKDEIQLQLFPPCEKWANVVNEKQILKNKIALNAYDINKLSINDISVYAFEGKIYLWSEKQNCQIQVKKMNMLNPALLPEIYKFIMALSKFNLEFYDYSFMNNISSFPYFPRLQYKNIIVRPKTWKIYYFNIGEAGFEKYLLKFRAEYNLDKYVFLVITDNKLFINIDNPSDIELLLYYLKKHEEIYLEEIFGINGNYLPLTKDNHLSELVFSLKNNRLHNILKRNRTLPFEDYKRESIMENYLYIKLYVDKNNADRILIKFIAPIVQACFQESDITSFFFIRYADPDFHIRIRFKGKKKLQSVLEKINTLYDKLFTKAIANKLEIEEFIPEIQRYGGPQYYNYVEEYFFCDSYFTLNVLELLNNKKLLLSRELITSISVLEMIKNIGLSYQESATLFCVDDIQNRKVVNYREYRNMLHMYFNSFGKDEQLTLLKKIIDLKLKDSKLCSLLELEDREQFFYTLNSVIHMSCNRINSTDDLFELKVREIVRAYLHDLKFRGNKEW